MSASIASKKSGREEAVRAPERFSPCRAPRLTADDKKVVRLLGDDIALVPRPFAGTARRARLSQEKIVETMRRFQKRGIMRRFAAILNHRKVGFKYNVMAVWAYPPEKSIDGAGKIISACPEVSHCYRRPTYPGWDYCLYAMIHCKKKSRCEELVKEISKKIKCKRVLALYGGREFKKARIRYFSDDFCRWEKRFMSR